MAPRRLIPLLGLVACSAKSDAPAPAPAPAAAAPPVVRCGDLARDSIAGVQLGLDEPTVLRRVGVPSTLTPPEERVNHQYTHRHWISRWTWQRHDLEVTWENLDSATAPRHVHSVVIGPHSDLATSCGIRIGATRADVERAYQQAIDQWKGQFGQAAAQGFVSAPATDGTSSDPILLFSTTGAILGTFEFEGDRVTTIAFLDPAIMFANQW